MSHLRDMRVGIFWIALNWPVQKFEFNTITFDVLDRFQQNKVLQIPQILNNIPRSSKRW